MNTNKEKYYKFFTILLSICFSYIAVFLYFFFNLEKNFVNNFKNRTTLSFYQKYSPLVNHLRYRDIYRFETIEQELLFNFIKNESDKRQILFLGDSWMEQINLTEGNKRHLSESFKAFSKIINGGTASHSPSLMHAQYKILEKDFKIKPDILVIYIDQTDMGDEICRYKYLLNINDEDKLMSVKMEKFPLYKEVFNLHEKISFSEIELKNSNKIVQTQKYINYKAMKSFFKIKKD